MKIIKASYALGVTIKKGDFQFVRIDISEEAEVEPGDDPNQVQKVLRDRVVAHVVNEINIWQGEQK